MFLFELVLFLFHAFTLKMAFADCLNCLLCFTHEMLSLLFAPCFIFQPLLGSLGSAPVSVESKLIFILQWPHLGKTYWKVIHQLSLDMVLRNVVIEFIAFLVMCSPHPTYLLCLVCLAL